MNGWIAALVSSLAIVAGCQQSTDGRPDLVLIVIDTLRADRLACYGGPPDVGKAICAPGSEGMRFVWAFSAVPYTAPSVASMLTSRYPSEHRVSQFKATPLGRDIETLAEALSGAGYATAAFVSNPVLRRGRGLERGFQVYDDQMTRRELHRPSYGQRIARETTDAALAWLRHASHPYFLMVHYQDPHGPYRPPDTPRPTDPPDAPRLPVLKNNSGWRGIPAYQALPGLHSFPAYERSYVNEIRYLDGHVERLLEALDARSPRPAILLTADHGESLGEDGYFFAHGHSVGLDQIRVPLLWRPPGAPRSGVVAEPVSTLDIAPTLLRAAGPSIPPAWHGRPLPEAPGDGRDATTPERTIFAEHPIRLAVVTRGSYFARDIRPLTQPVRDPNSGGLYHPLHPRAALLDPEAGRVRYHRLSGAPRDHFESLISDFLEQRPAETGPDAPLDPEMREALKALGYLE